MNYSFVFRRLSTVSMALGLCMLCAIPWAFPVLGGNWLHEAEGARGLFCAFVVSAITSLLFRYLGRNGNEQFSKKDATALVGLTWILATLLGALPYLLANVQRQEGVPMSVCDALFETQSGFSTTGATVFGELQRADLLPRCVMFWRCMTHFLGGLGIMILFVVLLGFGAGTKNIVRFEMTGPRNSSQNERIRQLTMIVFKLYLGMNIVQTFLLAVLGVPLYDAICHSFSTTSTGGFSTFNAAAGHFAAEGYTYAVTIEWILILFMFLGGTNFILLYWLCVGQPGRLLRDTEWKVYVAVILVAVLVVFVAGIIGNDFDNYGTAEKPFYASEKPVADPFLEQQEEFYEHNIFQLDREGSLEIHAPTVQSEKAAAPRESVPLRHAFRVTVFHVVSILTTTGLCTDEFEKWSGLSCGVFILLIFLGGCAGSTAGGFKIIRAVCLLKSLPQEVELTYRPNVVRPLLIGGSPIDKEVVRHIMVHFCLLIAVFSVGTILVLFFEPISTWGADVPVTGDRKLADTACAVTSCLNNVGPGLGLIGAKQNFGSFSEASKFVFIWLMVLGRLELFVILSLFHPGFWRT